jgi:arylsulfatase A-like enzyme
MDKKASYYAMIDLIDEQLGRLFEKLEALGQRDNTVIIFMSDHGEMLGDHGLIQKGCRFNEGAVRVPLIVSCPQRFATGETYDGLIELVDIAPTLAELAGIPFPTVHGKSLLPLLEGRADQYTPRTHAYCEYFDCVSEYDVEGRLIPTVNPSMGTMYTDGAYKLVIYHNVGLGELYDLKNDPDEFTNLWDEPNYAAIRADLMLKSYNLTILSADMGPEKIHPF